MKTKQRSIEFRTIVLLIFPLRNEECFCKVWDLKSKIEIENLEDEHSLSFSKRDGMEKGGIRFPNLLRPFLVSELRPVPHRSLQHIKVAGLPVLCD